jgi:hypothetical protein
MPSVASHVGRMQHRHDVERDMQEDAFAAEQQQARAKEDQKRQDQIDKAEKRSRTAPPSGGRAPLRSVSDEEHRDSRVAAIQALQHTQDGKRKALRDRQNNEIEAARSKGETPGQHVAPREPEPHHGISTIWKSLGGERQQAVRDVMEKFARLHDKADDDVLNLNKSTSADRYAKAGGRVAMGMASQHEEAHRKIAKDEYDRLRTLWAQYEGELESERRMIHEHATQRGMLYQRQHEELMARRR